MVRYGGILEELTLLTLRYWKCGRKLQANHPKGFPDAAHWSLNISGHMSENKSVSDIWLGPAFDITHSELCCISMWYCREVDPKLLCLNYRKVEQWSLCKHRWLKLSNWLRLSLYWNPWWGPKMGPPGRSRCLLKRVQAAKEQTLAIFVETYEELGNIVLRAFYSIWLK